MNKITFLIVGAGLAIFSANALANGGSYYPQAAPAAKPASVASFYIGTGLGYAMTHWRNYYHNIESTGMNQFLDSYTNTINATSDNGFAARFYGGFQFNKYAAIEIGYVLLPSVKITNTYKVPNPTQSKPLTVTHPKINNYVVDFLLKLRWPIYHGFGIFTRVGAGYINSSFKGDMVNTSLDKVVPATFSLDNKYDRSNQHFGPAFGFGLNYVINPYVTVNASWMHYTGFDRIPNSKDTKILFQPSPDVFMGGVSFHLPISTFNRED